MPKTAYHERPVQVHAEQFEASKAPPYPQYVDDCGRIEGPHVHIGTETPTLIPVHDTDWIVTAFIDSVSVLTDAEFQATYVKVTGP